MIIQHQQHQIRLKSSEALNMNDVKNSISINNHGVSEIILPFACVSLPMQAGNSDIGITIFTRDLDPMDL